MFCGLSQNYQNLKKKRKKKKHPEANCFTTSQMALNGLFVCLFVGLFVCLFVCQVVLECVFLR